VIVLGDNRGDRLQVRIEKKKRKRHCGVPSLASQPDHAVRDEQRQAEEERAQRERDRMERKRHFWHEQLQPALLSAIVEKTSHQKKVTTPLMNAVLDALTAREELETLCAPINEVTLDRSPSVLLVAIACRRERPASPSSRPAGPTPAPRQE
jgi:hypothetical protein